MPNRRPPSRARGIHRLHVLARLEKATPMLGSAHLQVATECLSNDIGSGRVFCRGAFVDCPAQFWIQPHWECLGRRAPHSGSAWSSPEFCDVETRFGLTGHLLQDILG